MVLAPLGAAVRAGILTVLAHMCEVVVRGGTIRGDCWRGLLGEVLYLPLRAPAGIWLRSSLGTVLRTVTAASLWTSLRTSLRNMAYAAAILLLQVSSGVWNCSSCLTIIHEEDGWRNRYVLLAGQSLPVYARVENLNNSAYIIVHWSPPQDILEFP